jgi:hypothetical protein
VCSGKLFGVCRVSEPLDEALGDKFSDRLSGVASMIEVVQGDADESVSFGGAF